jgi:hypothetical protein
LGSFFVVGYKCTIEICTHYGGDKTVKKRKFAIVIFMMTILMLNTSLALADNFKIKILDPGILPDSPDYESKQIQEKKKMETFTDSLEKAGYHLELAERRMVEAMFMEEKGKPQFVDELVRRYDENLIQALQYLAEGQSREKEDFDETIATIRTSTRIHMDELTALLDQVPEVSRPTIELAIDRSWIVSNISVNELENIIPDKLSTGAPEKVKTGPPEEPPGQLKKDTEMKNVGPKEEPPSLSKQEEKEKFTGPPETLPGLIDKDKDTGPPEEPPGLSKQEEKEKDKEKDNGSQKEPPGQLKKDTQDEKVKETGPAEEPPGLSKQEEKDKDTGPAETPPGLSGKDKDQGPPE